MLQNIFGKQLPRRFSLCLMLRGVTDDIVHTLRGDTPHYLCNMMSNL